MQRENMYKISILTIGDEICIGQIVNSNAAWIAEQLSKTGADVFKHSTVGDKKEIMKSELESLLQSSNAVIITGGLGPTSDDITKPVLADFFNDELVLHKPTLDFLVERYKKRGIELSGRNREIAMLPSKCEVLTNAVGTAPGMLFRHNGKLVFSTPGVPNEMNYIIKNHALEIIKKEIIKGRYETSLFKTLHTIGIAESNLADLIGDEKEFIGPSSLAYLPSYRGVRLRITVKGKTFEEGNREINRIETILREKAGDYIFGENDVNIASVVAGLLKEKGKTVSVAESCTGGMLGAALTDIAGSSDYFYGGVIVYSNEAKSKQLDVPEDTLKQHGAVSEETALQLATNVRKKFGTDYGIGITGIAGPTGGTEEKPVGTVWISLADENGSAARKYVFVSDRAVNRELSVGTALGILFTKLKGLH